MYRARLIYDTVTKKFVDEIKPGDKITRLASVEAYRKIKESRYTAPYKKTKQDWNSGSFYKGNIEEIRAVMPELDTYEKAFLYSVAPFIGYEDCCIKYDNGRELSFQTLSEISGISTGKLSKVIKSLIDKDILYKGKNSKNTQYFVNPWLFYKGNVINKTLKTMFKNYKIRTLGVRWREL